MANTGLVSQDRQSAPPRGAATNAVKLVHRNEDGAHATEEKKFAAVSAQGRIRRRHRPLPGPLAPPPQKQRATVGAGGDAAGGRANRRPTSRRSISLSLGQGLERTLSPTSPPLQPQPRDQFITGVTLRRASKGQSVAFSANGSTTRAIAPLARAVRGGRKDY